MVYYGSPACNRELPKSVSSYQLTVRLFQFAVSDLTVLLFSLVPMGSVCVCPCQSSQPGSGLPWSLLLAQAACLHGRAAGVYLEVGLQ